MRIYCKQETNENYFQLLYCIKQMHHQIWVATGRRAKIWQWFQAKANAKILYTWVQREICFEDGCYSYPYSSFPTRKERIVQKPRCQGFQSNYMHFGKGFVYLKKITPIVRYKVFNVETWTREPWRVSKVQTFKLGCLVVKMLSFKFLFKCGNAYDRVKQQNCWEEVVNHDHEP